MVYIATTDTGLLVRAVREIWAGNRSKFCKGLKFCTDVVNTILNSFFEGAGADCQWSRHIGKFKMDAIVILNFP